MTMPLPEPPTSSRWRRAPLGPDIFTAFLLFLVESWLCFLVALTWGMAGWAADGSAAKLDAASLAGISHLRYLLVGALVCAGVAAVLRAPWSTGSQLVIAGALALLMVQAQHGYDRAHQPARPPSPTPSVWVEPCYSGSRGPSCR
jgi:hypothetical protein